MKAFFDIKQGTLVPSDDAAAKVVVYTTPDETEKQELVTALDLPRHDVESALDPDEISRIEFTPDYTYVIWKRPNSVTYDQQIKFEVSSFGMVLQKDRITIICANAIPFESAEFRRVTSLNSLMMRLFLQIIHHYFGHLKGIKMLAAELQAKLNVSQENRYLLQMFTLGESLIYYLNAITANGAVLTKIRSSAEKMGFTPDEIEMLDDVIIEQQQCNRQTEIYSSVLSGLMDARASIINNNMNVLLRNLTIINVVFLPLNLIASIGGMSEYSMMTRPIHWVVSYSIFGVTMVILGLLTWTILVRRMQTRAELRKRP